MIHDVKEGVITSMADLRTEVIPESPDIEVTFCFFAHSWSIRLFCYKQNNMFFISKTLTLILRLSSEEICSLILS